MWATFQRAGRARENLVQAVHVLAPPPEEEKRAAVCGPGAPQEPTSHTMAFLLATSDCSYRANRRRHCAWRFQHSATFRTDEPSSLHASAARPYNPTASSWRPCLSAFSACSYSAAARRAASWRGGLCLLLIANNSALASVAVVRRSRFAPPACEDANGRRHAGARSAPRLLQGRWASWRVRLNLQLEELCMRLQAAADRAGFSKLRCAVAARERHEG